jgi:signal transduction histidine kinase
VFEELRARYPTHPVDVVVGAGLSVHGDPQLLRVLLVNLLDNAFKYTHGRPGSRVEVGWADTEAGRAIRVQDNGVGFDMELAAGLFKPFQRLHGSSEVEGTGIGLATVRRVVERHGGRVWVEAELDRGASFFVWLPGM